MKYLLSYIKKFLPKQPIKPMGRWNNEYCDVKTSQKVDLSNEDHCGPCGQYALSKQEVQKNRRKESQFLITRSYGRQPFRKVFPNCAECKYYDKKELEAYSRCKMFEFENHLNDSVEYEYADYARRCESKCGEEGRLYVRGDVVREER
jgi:hypothetical protein